MNRNLRWLLIGFCVGFLLFGTLCLLMFVLFPPFGRTLEQLPTSTTDYSRQANVEASHAPLGGVRVTQRDIANLVSSLAEQGRFSRSLNLYEYLADASLEKLAEIVGSTRDVQPSSLRHQIQTTVVRRTRLEDFESAVEMLSTVSESIRESLTVETFAEWAKYDFKAATAHARELDEINRLHALRGILRGSRGPSRNQLSAIAQTLGHEEEFNDHIALEVIDEDLESPASAWKEFLSEFGDSLGELSETQRGVLAEIAVAWIKEDEFGAIQAIRQLREIESGRQSILASMLARIAKDDLVYALTVAAELGIQNRRVLVEVLESAVAEQQPQVAFLALSKYEKHGTRRALQRFVIETWAHTDPMGLIDFLGNLPMDLRRWGEEKAYLGLAQIDPKRASEAIPVLKRQASRKSVSLEVARYWSRIDPVGALGWTASDETVAGWRMLLQQTILKELAVEDPDRALELALGQHVAENEIGLEATVIEGLVDIDIDRAMAMLEHVRNQSTREASFSSIGNALILRGRSDQALELVKEESEDFQAAYFDSVANIWAYFDPTDLFTKIESLPTDQIRKNLAGKLAFMHSVKGFLNPEQKEELMKYLPTAMRGMLE